MLLSEKELENAYVMVAKLNSIFKSKSPLIEGFFGIKELTQVDGKIDCSLYFSMPRHGVFVEMGQDQRKEVPVP